MKDLIYQLELSLLTPETRHSPAHLNQLIADDFVEFGSSGNIYGKRDCIAYLPLESSSDKEFKIEISKLSSYRQMLSLPLIR